jgi:hypothetical protein
MRREGAKSAKADAKKCDFAKRFDVVILSSSRLPLRSSHLRGALVFIAGCIIC